MRACWPYPGAPPVSRRPYRSPNRKLTDQDQAAILRLRGEGNGARRIQTELRLFEQTKFSLATIHKVLTAANVKPLIKPKRSHVPHRYNRPIPGDRVQMDTMKIVPGVYQYTTCLEECERQFLLSSYGTTGGWPRPPRPSGSDRKNLWERLRRLKLTAPEHALRQEMESGNAE
jgi:hypothetical protein